MEYKDPNPQYWEDYTHLQYTKHALLKRYLGAWFPILSSYNGRILFIDTHAGKGKYSSEIKGSPLIALDVLLNHRLFNKIINGCEVIFDFIEMDKENHSSLTKEIEAYRTIHQDKLSNIVIEAHHGNCYDILNDLVKYLRKKGRNLAPAFLFIDPYGFDIPGELLRDLMSFPRVEMIVNIMWRYINMAIGRSQDPGMTKRLNTLFSNEDWKAISAPEADDKLQQCASLLTKMVNATWGTSIKMLAENRTVLYFLLHLTNNDRGRDIIKDCIWKLTYGTFCACRADDYSQQILVSNDPNFKEIENWILERLRVASMRWSELEDDNRNTFWLTKHLNDCIRKLRREGIIVDSNPVITTRFSRKTNPILRIADS